MKKAFSLLEISVSIVIISLLMAIVSQSIKLIPSSKLTNARSITSSAPIRSISGLVAWYETSSVDSFKTNEAVDKKQITTWYDISPESITEKKNVLTRTASTAVTYEAKGINDIPSVRFNGTNSISLTNFYQGTSTQNTIFFVVKPLALSTSVVSMVVDSGCGGQIASVSLLQSPNIELHLQNTAYPTLPSMISVGTSYLVAAYYNGASSKVYVNDATNMAGGTTFNLGTANVLTGLSIGGRCAFYNLNGLVSEVIIYNRSLKDSERKEVMRYLSKKYAIKITGI